LTNYYEVLGVPRDATDAAVRDRFRVLAREEHPDRFTDASRKAAAEARFQLLTEAVNVLTSVQRRKAHDFDLDKGKTGPVTHDPQAVAKVYLAKGVRAYKEGDFPQAVAMFELSVQHWNKDPKALHYLALACCKVPGQARKGVDAIEAALKMEPDNGVFHREAGKLYLAAGLRAKAERHFEEAARWDPDDSAVRRGLAELRPADSKNILGNLFGRKG